MTAWYITFDNSTNFYQLFFATTEANKKNLYKTLLFEKGDNNCEILKTWKRILFITAVVVIAAIITLLEMFPKEFKTWDLQNWVQINSPCSQGLARCHVTRQHCSAALSPKLYGTEKLLPSHHLRLRRSFFPNLQIVGELVCLKAQSFDHDEHTTGTNHQCWHTCPLCKKQQTLLPIITITIWHCDRHKKMCKIILKTLSLRGYTSLHELTQVNQFH